MDSIRYRTLFTVVLLLFSVLIFYELVGEVRFRGYIQEVRTYTINPILDEVNEVAHTILERDELRSYQEFNAEGTIGVGAYFPDLSENRFFRVVDHENLIGHKLQYLLLFRAWGDDDKDFPNDYVENMKKLDLVPIITWEPWGRDFDDATTIQTEYSLESIVAGRHDDYIKKWANDAREADMLVVIRFAHEQSTHPGERSWYPWQGKPATYVTAFRKIVQIFREEGANNVRFMWNPVSFWPDSTITYYPGDRYVDYLGFTVLNHGTDSGQEDARWKRCEELLTDQYEVVSEVDKPIVLVEFASSEKGGSKKSWWKDCFDKAKEIENLVGVITLEAEKDVAFPRVRWGVDTSIESLDTFRDEISDPLFK